MKRKINNYTIKKDINISDNSRSKYIWIKESNIKNSILSVCLILSILFFIFYDYNRMKHKIEIQIPIISTQLDSLSSQLYEKSILINQNLIKYKEDINGIRAIYGLSQ